MYQLNDDINWLSICHDSQRTMVAMFSLSCYNIFNNSAWYASGHRPVIPFIKWSSKDMVWRHKEDLAGVSSTSST